MRPPNLLQPVILSIPLMLSACQRGLEPCSDANPFLCAGAPMQSSTGELSSSGNAPTSSGATTDILTSSTFDSGDLSTTADLNAICGDGVVSGQELCDDNNDVDLDNCSNGCISQRRVFVTSQAFSGALGGLKGADILCETLAKNANIPGTFKAWLSDVDDWPRERFESNFVGHYILVDGTIIAKDWGGLTDIDGALLHPIDLDESNSTHQEDSVWTSTTQIGEYSNSPHCGKWMETDGFGRTGITSNIMGQWTNTGVQATCDSALRLYCFEDYFMDN